MAISKASSKSGIEACDLEAQTQTEPVHETEAYKYLLIDDYYEAQNKCVLSKLPSARLARTATHCDRDRKSGKDHLGRVDIYYKVSTTLQAKCQKARKFLAVFS